MKPGSNPVFPFGHGQVQFMGMSVRDLARIAALHGLLVGGTDLDPQEASDFARKAADGLFPQAEKSEGAINLTEELEAAVRDAHTRQASAKRPWRLW